MKVTKNKPAFEPITIVLESQEELDCLQYAVGMVGGKPAFYYDLFAALKKYGADHQNAADNL